MSRVARRGWGLRLLVSTSAALVGALVCSAPVPAQDFAGSSHNVLPPGQEGGIVVTPNSHDQLALYDGLTPKLDNVTAADLDTFYKPAGLGIGSETPARIENPPGHPGVTIKRDSFDVPHIDGKTRDDVMFGAGWVAAEDRGLLIDVLRGPGRLAAIDAPGLDPFSIANQLRGFTPTQQTEDFLNQQVGPLKKKGARGKRVLADIQAYADGINAYRSDVVHSNPKPWTQADTLACAALIGAVFGKGGGDEVRRAELLSALQSRLGQAQGLKLWNDLREQGDPETPATIVRTFPYGASVANGAGNAIIDDGTLGLAAPLASAVRARGHQASNALLIGASKSSNGHPLFVAGPQVGYYYPEILMEEDLHGGGIDARGATFAGAAPYVLLGRGPDFSWSATSASSDLIDQYAEKLCGDDTHYVYKGKCLAMTDFDAGDLTGPTQHVSFKETVHGPVIGYAKVNGERVAISQKRSTRGREGLSALGFVDLNDNAVRSPKTFIKAASKVDFTFNWFYADDQHIAMFSSGRLPKRAKGVDSGLPTWGTGKYEWHGFLSVGRHAHVIDPPSGRIVNWNNKPANGFDASDENWAYGSIQRSLLLDHALDRQFSAHSQLALENVVAAMNRAATQDLRVVEVLPSIKTVLDTRPAPSARDQQMLDLLDSWRTAGGSRIDTDLDGKIDDPGAAILDAAWPKIADAVMSPALGPQLGQLQSLVSVDDKPNRGGSSYFEGWYGYVHKDLRELAGQAVTGAFNTRFCGSGNLASCSSDLWNAIDQAGNDLQSAQGSDPTLWRSDATGERIHFAPGLLQETMRWTNRPTFQQAMSYSGHR